MPVSMTCTSRNSWTRFCRPKVAINTLVAVGVGYYVLALVGGHYKYINSQNSNQINQQIHETADPIEPKRILYWTEFYGSKNMLFGFGKEPFIRNGCPVTNCWASADRSDLNRSDAIIFHVNTDFNETDLPGHRFQNQRYIFYHLEAHPVGRWGQPSPGLKVAPHFYNWTMTHRRDSDVYMSWTYGAMKRKSESVVLNWLPPPLPKNGKPLLPSKLMEIASTDSQAFSNRTKMIAWFCSHTKTHGQREDYVKELGKYVQMDVYGACGNLTCKPNMGTPCDSLLNNYKFYFAAENSFCPDYVTEKFYRALKNGIIPIVYGGADYAQYAPPHSYIHVADFSSPKDLAEYLHFLAGNEAIYSTYFDWKKDWEVINNPYNGLCELCAKLNDPESSIETKTYEDISKWWYDDVPCYPGNSFLDSLVKTH